MRWSSIASALVGAALVIAGAVGCSHCDTCDDFPAPCPGGDCGYGTSNPMMGSGPVTMAPGGPALSPAPSGVTTAPAAAKPATTKPAAPAGMGADRVLPETPPAAPALPGGSPFEP